MLAGERGEGRWRGGGGRIGVFFPRSCSKACFFVAPGLVVGIQQTGGSNQKRKQKSDSQVSEWMRLMLLGFLSSSLVLRTGALSSSVGIERNSK